jgi:hypothetical protein
LKRERSKQAVERVIYERCVALTIAQMDEAMGVEYLVIRRPDGSFVRATDQAQIDAAVAAGGELCRLYRKAPNPQAYRELMTQGFGKPPKALQIEGSAGGPLEIRVKTPW